MKSVNSSFRHLSDSEVVRAFKKMVRQDVGVVIPWVLIINGCVHLGTDLFNHSKRLFSNRALDKFSECQYNMSFHVQKRHFKWLVGHTK